jgi:hypothetical protein
MKENKKIERREPSQEDESDKPHHLEFIHPTSQPNPKNFLEAIFAKCLTLPNNLENPHQSLEVFDLAILSIHIKVNFMAQSFVQLSLRQLKTKLKQMNTFVCLI